MTNSLWPAAFIAALFAWHPLHVESVAWISERKDVLSTFFALLALLSYTRYAKENSRRSFWFALVFFALGLMSKPMLVTLPFVMLLLDYWPLKRISFPSTLNSQLSTVFEKMAVLSAHHHFLRRHFFRATQRRMPSIRSQMVPLHYRFYNTVISYGRYLLKMVWPSDLAVIYPLSEDLAWMHRAAAVSGAVLLLISWLVWRGCRARPYLLVGWLWFLGTLVPVIGLVQVGGAALADRYTYFPLIGIFIAVTFGVRDLADRFQIPKTIPAVAGRLDPRLPA